MGQHEEQEIQKDMILFGLKTDLIQVIELLEENPDSIPLQDLKDMKYHLQSLLEVINVKQRREQQNREKVRLRGFSNTTNRATLSGLQKDISRNSRSK